VATTRQPSAANRLTVSGPTRPDAPVISTVSDMSGLDPANIPSARTVIQSTNKFSRFSVSDGRVRAKSGVTLQETSKTSATALASPQQTGER
jgi:hypothetical protein